MKATNFDSFFFVLGHVFPAHRTSPQVGPVFDELPVARLLIFLFVLGHIFPAQQQFGSVSDELPVARLLMTTMTQTQLMVDSHLLRLPTSDVSQ